MSMGVLLLASALSAAPVVPHAVGVTRGAVPLAVIAAPESPWATVHLLVRLPAGELPPAERAHLAELARALAAMPDMSAVAGVARARAAPDHLALSFGAPAASLDVALRAANDVLAKHRLVKPAATSPASAPSFEPDLDARALALAFPGSDLTLPLATAGASALRPGELGALAARVLRRDRVAVVVVGPGVEAELLERAARALSAPLLPSLAAANGAAANGAALSGAAANGTASLAPETGVRLSETTDADVRGARSTVWLLGPGRGSAGASPKDRAARAVLARLLGGRSETNPVAFAITVDVEAARPAGIARAEGKVLSGFEAIARTPPPSDVVTAEATRERAARLDRLREPDALADAIGRALLAGDAGLVDRELEALAALTPDDVAAAARVAASGPRVIWRVLGATP